MADNETTFLKTLLIFLLRHSQFTIAYKHIIGIIANI